MATPEEHPRPRRAQWVGPCEWCIYGNGVWYVEYSWQDDESEYGKNLCDRCLNDIQNRAARGWVHVWWVEES